MIKNILIIFVSLFFCIIGINAVTHYEQSSNYTDVTNNAMWNYGIILHGGWTTLDSSKFAFTPASSNYNRGAKFSINAVGINDNNYLNISFNNLQTHDRWNHIGIYGSDNLGFSVERYTLSGALMEGVSVRSVSSTGYTNFGISNADVKTTYDINTKDTTAINYNILFNGSHVKIYRGGSVIIDWISLGKTMTSVSKIDIFTQAFDSGSDEISNLKIEQTTTSNTPILEVNILNITANGNLFVNETIFTTNNIEFIVNYEVLNSDIGNFTNSTTTNLNGLTDGTYTIEFEVCYNSTCDTSINYTYYINVSLPVPYMTYYNVPFYTNISNGVWLKENQKNVRFRTTGNDVYTWNIISNKGYSAFQYGVFGEYPLHNNYQGEYIINVTITDNESNFRTTQFNVNYDSILPTITNNIPNEFNSYQFNGNWFSCSDTNLKSCNITINSQNKATGTNFTLSQNGNLSYTITAIDLANNIRTQSGVLFVDPKFYIYFENVTNTISNFTINGTLYENYFDGNIYDYGLGNHTFLFSKAEYEDLIFQLKFNTTSNINTSYVVDGAYINIFIREINNGSLVSPNNFTILYNDENGNSETYSIINNNTIKIRNIYEYDTEATINLVDSNNSIITNKILVTSRNEVNLSFYVATGETLYTKYIEVLTAGLVVIPFTFVELYVNLKDTNEFVLLQQKQTNEIGVVTFEVVPSTYIYTICNTYMNNRKCLNQVIFDTPILDYQLIHTSTLEGNVRNILEYISYSYSEVKTNTTSQMTFYFNDKQSNVDYFCLNVSRYINDIQYNLGGICSPNSASSIVSTYALTENQYLEYTFSYKINNTYYLLNKIVSRYQGQAEVDFRDSGLLDLIFLMLIFGGIGVLLSFKNMELYAIGFLSLLLLLSLAQVYFNRSYVEITLWGVLTLKHLFVYFVRAD